MVDPNLIRTYLFVYIAPKTADEGNDCVAIDAVMPALREQIGVLAKAVARWSHLVDDQFTFADINLTPIHDRVRQFPQGPEKRGAARHLAGYYERHAARKRFERTTQPPGPTPAIKTELAQLSWGALHVRP